jgi:hypothetical protein
MAVRKGKAYTLSFAVVDNTNRPSRKSGITFVAGDTKISKDGASFSNTTNAPAEIGSSGRYSLALTAAEMAADFIHVYVEKTGIDPIEFQLGTSGYESATIVTDVGNSSTAFKTDRSASTTDDIKDVLVVFTSGSLAGQVKKVSGYNGTSKVITVSSAYTGTPSNGDRFILVNI